MMEMRMDMIEQWASELAAKGRKQTTIRTYTRSAVQMMETLEAMGLPTEPEHIDGDVMRLLASTMTDRTVSTVRGYLWSLGAYVEWETGRNPYKEADFLWSEVEYPNRVYVERDDLAEAAEMADPATYLILTLGSCMGLRRSEIAALRLTDVQGPRLRVTGKGHGPGKVSIMTIPATVRDALDGWMVERERMAARAREDVSDGHILVRMHYGAMVAMSPESVYYRVHKLSEVSGVRMTTHSLRRRFATGLYEGGVNLIDIKTLMRHEDIGTTISCYIKPNDRRLDEIMAEVRI